MIHTCLWHVNDQVRIVAYKFVCDNYSEQMSQYSLINLPMILDVLVNNLTSDNPGFRNHLISATRRLFVFIRDSVVSHISHAESVMKDVSFVMDRMKHLYTDRTSCLESISWTFEINKIGDSVHYRDIGEFNMDYVSQLHSRDSY